MTDLLFLASLKNILLYLTTCSTEPTACAKVKCQYYADCRVSGDVAQCVCPGNCDSVPKAQLCGNDGQTYESICHMKQASCQKKELVLKAYDGECGKFK